MTPYMFCVAGPTVTTTVPSMTEALRITGQNHSAIHDRGPQDHWTQDHWSQPQCHPWQSQSGSLVTTTVPSMTESVRITGQNHSAIHDSQSGSLVTTTVPSMTVTQDHWSQQQCQPWQSRSGSRHSGSLVTTTMPSITEALRITGHSPIQDSHSGSMVTTTEPSMIEAPWITTMPKTRISAVGEVLHTDSYQTKSREKTLVLDRKQQMNLLACNVGC